MRRILICSGVLGGGTALVFAAAAVTAVLIPPSRIVPQFQDVMAGRGGPAMIRPFGGVVVDDAGKGAPVTVEVAP